MIGTGVSRNGWDPASSVGLTATEAAAARAVASRRPTPLINDPYAEPLARAVGVDFFIQLAEQGCETGESAFALPGMVDWVAARTRFFDDYFIANQAAGIRQSVILGAGLDCRAFRLAWSPNSKVYEVDQPGVIEFKSATMARLNVNPRADRRPVAVDLRGDWVPSLRERGFDPSLPTTWSAEGLLPYLPSDAQQRLLDDVSELSAEGSWFAADTAVDGGQLAAQIVSSLGGSDRPAETKAVVGAAVATSVRAQLDAVRHLRLQNWASMGFAAPDLFAAYGLPAPPADQSIYDHIVFVTAVRGQEQRDFSTPTTRA